MAPRCVIQRRADGNPRTSGHIKEKGREGRREGRWGGEKGGGEKKRKEGTDGRTDGGWYGRKAERAVGWVVGGRIRYIRPSTRTRVHARMRGHMLDAVEGDDGFGAITI